VLGQEHGPQLGEPLGWIVERAQDDRALVDREREQLHLVRNAMLEPVAQVVGAGSPAERGELIDRVGWDGRPASIIAARL
jgi:hypothetical protein